MKRNMLIGTIAIASSVFSMTAKYDWFTIVALFTIGIFMFVIAFVKGK